jgi:hypothetical protein
MIDYAYVWECVWLTTTAHMTSFHRDNTQSTNCSFKMNVCSHFNPYQNKHIMYLCDNIYFFLGYWWLAYGNGRWVIIYFYFPCLYFNICLSYLWLYIHFYYASMTLLLTWRLKPWYYYSVAWFSWLIKFWFICDVKCFVSVTWFYFFIVQRPHLSIWLLTFYSPTISLLWWPVSEEIEFCLYYVLRAPHSFVPNHPFEK